MFKRSIWAPTLVMAFLLASLSPSVAHRATAASITSFSVNLSRIKASTAGNQEIFFVSPSGIDAGETVRLTYSSDFTLGSVGEDDLDFATGSTGTCTSATYTEQATASSPSGATWGVGVSGQQITITSGTGTLTAGRCVRIRIGTNATNSGTGANQITNGSSDDDDTVSVDGTFGDTGTATIDIIGDDQVVITASVAPSFTFTISDNTIGFGTLLTGSARYATGDGNGSSSDNGGAHTLQVFTNAASGYFIGYQGNTLTNGIHSISAATITADPNGTPGTEQFAISVNSEATFATLTSGYEYDYDTLTNTNWKFEPNTYTTIATRSSPPPGVAQALGIHYLANIATTTEPGTYTSTITYIAAPNF